MIDWLLDASVFFKRSHCGDWPYWFRYYYGLANLTICIEYMLIPAMIAVIGISKRHLFGRPWLTWMWVTFIFCCGVSHFCELLTFWWPAYHLFATWDWITALAGLPVVVTSPFVILELLNNPTIKQLKEKEAALNEGLDRINAIRDMLESDLVWRMSDQRKLSELVEGLRSQFSESPPDGKRNTTTEEDGRRNNG